MQMPLRIGFITVLLLLTFADVSAQSPWQVIARPTTKDLLKTSFIDSLRGWVCGREGVILKTTNGGQTWTQQSSGVTDDMLGLFMLNEQIGWAISWVNFTDTNSYYGSRILKTTNGGATWSSTILPVNDKYFHSIVFFDSLNGWICGVRGDVEKTTDGGTTWLRMTIDSSAVSDYDMLHLSFSSPNYGFAAGGLMDISGVIWRTTDGGQRWQAQSVAPEPVYRIHFSDSIHALALTGDLEYGAGIVRTKDGGDHWEYTYLGLFGLPRAMSFRTPREGWVALGNMVMVTYDTAQTWQIVDTLGWRQMFDLTFTDSLTGFAVADSGTIYKFSRRSVDVHRSEPAAPVTHHLEQNYPNPFNAATQIRFTVGQSSVDETVSLRVTNLLGQEIATLVNGKRRAGTYITVWNAPDAPSGIYFLRLTVGAFVDVKKMLLIR